MLIGSNAIGRCGEIASEEFSVRVPDGIIAANDHIARKVVEAAARHNLKAGSDFLLVGFDDWVDSQAHGISSMRPPIEELGQVAAKLALRAIAGDTTYQRVCLCSHLLKRNSTSGTFRRTPEV
jgi:LacI family transcriptional regulator